MKDDSKARVIHILEYLWKNTDDEHHATITEMLEYLKSVGITANRRTIPSDIEELQKFGFDIILTKSTQNRYHIGNRTFETPELKLLVDAVQSSHFITKAKSKELIDKLCTLTSLHEAKSLNRHLYVEKRVKPMNERIYYSVDLIQSAINNKRQISFQYCMYNANKKKVFKHDGRRYILSPYDMIWNDDSYYAVGYSESHNAVIKFRVDRIENPEMLDTPAVCCPKGYNIETYSKQVFSMYEGKTYTVKLKCNNELMNTVIDRFGTGVKTEISDDKHFTVTVEISASPTFYGWLFIFAERIKVISPDEVKNEYQRLARAVTDD